MAGTGLVTTSMDYSSVHFDLNNDYFAERTGWTAGGAGFLVYDRNANGRIDNASRAEVIPLGKKRGSTQTCVAARGRLAQDMAWAA